MVTKPATKEVREDELRLSVMAYGLNQLNLELFSLQRKFQSVYWYHFDCLVEILCMLYILRLLCANKKQK